MQTTAIGTVTNSLPQNEVILLTLLISKGYIPYTDLPKIDDFGVRVRSPIETERLVRHWNVDFPLLDLQFDRAIVSRRRDRDAYRQRGRRIDVKRQSRVIRRRLFRFQIHHLQFLSLRRRDGR